MHCQTGNRMFLAPFRAIASNAIVRDAIRKYFPGYGDPMFRCRLFILPGTCERILLYFSYNQIGEISKYISLEIGTFHFREVEIGDSRDFILEILLNSKIRVYTCIKKFSINFTNVLLTICIHILLLILTIFLILA